MLLFGADVPLIEIIFALVIILFVLLVESIVLVVLLVKQTKDMKKLLHARVQEKPAVKSRR